jgi:hypothetical protein
LEDREVEREATGPDVGGEHGRADASVVAAGKDAVFVCFSPRAVAGVEVFGDSFDREDANARGQGVVEGTIKIRRGDGDGEGEGGHLTEGVDAGVGAAGALRENSFAAHALDCLRQSALDSGEAGLDLPTVVGGAVVGQDEFPVRHGVDLDGITVDCLIKDLSETANLKDRRMQMGG